MHPGRPFLRFREGTLAYGEVDRLANRLAHGLGARGVGPGSHVAVMLPNSPDFLVVTFALAKLGAVLVPINTAYKGELLQHVLQDSNTSSLVVDACHLDQFAPIEGQLGDIAQVIVRTERGRSSPRGLISSSVTLEEALGDSTDPPDIPVRPGDLQAIMFTSGTTGLSKGVMSPHALGLICAEDSTRYLAYQPGETIYCPLPLFHAAALWDGVMSALLMGSDIAIVERLSASRFWDDVRHFSAHVAMGIFSMIPILLKAPPTPHDRDHSLRALYLGKSALDEEFHARFGVRSVETYTSTEVGIGTGSPYGAWRPGSCGQVNRETHDVLVVDPGDRELGPGEIGELVVRPRRPFALTPGYYNCPEATVGLFRNLWFHTGDRAYRDEDGYFYFVDRIKDSIRRRGENISAFEVERAVNSHPSVLECAALPVPSELEEDELKVDVVPRRGACVSHEELAAFCEDRLPSFMVPRYIELVDELPRTPIGKIAKHELRRRGENGITSKTWDRQGSRARQAGRATGR